MTARTKLKELTGSWYLYVLFSGVVSLFANGLGMFSLIFTGLSTVVGLVITFAIGRALLARNHVLRWVLVVIAGLTVIFGGLGLVELTRELLEAFQLSLLWTMVLTFVSVGMNLHSLRVLFNARVRAYFR